MLKVTHYELSGITEDEYKTIREFQHIHEVMSNTKDFKVISASLTRILEILNYFYENDDVMEVLQVIAISYMNIC